MHRHSAPVSSCTHGAISFASSIHIIAVHPWGWTGVVDSHGSLLLLVIVDVDEVESVDVPRQEAEDGQANVNEQVSAAA